VAVAGIARVRRRWRWSPTSARPWGGDPPEPIHSRVSPPPRGAEAEEHRFGILGTTGIMDDRINNAAKEMPFDAAALLVPEHYCSRLS